MNECLMFKELEIMKTNLSIKNTIMGTIFGTRNSARSLGLAACLLVIGCMQVWGTTYTFDLSSNTAGQGGAMTYWYSDAGCNTHVCKYYSTSNPTTHYNRWDSPQTMYYKDATITTAKTFVVSSSASSIYAYFQNANPSYLVFGKQNSYLTLPTFSGEKITNVTVTTSSTVAGSAEINVYSGDNEASETQTTTSNSSTDLSFDITSTYQNDELKIVVENDKNFQLTQIVITTVTGYAVTYNNGGHGTAPSSTTATAVTLPALTAAGYINTGWKANVAVTNTSTSASISAGTLIENGTNVTLSQATTFTAQWRALTNYHTRCLTVTYAAGEGSGTAPSSHEKVNPNSTITLAANTFTAPTGKAFDGWHDGTSKYDAGASYTVTASKTMTAQWAFIDYNVTYSAPSNGNYTIKVADGEASSATKTAHYGQTITLNATPNTGYSFTSWTVTKAGGGTVTVTNNQFTMPAENVTVTATFTIIDYNVTYVAPSNGNYTIKVGSGTASSASKTANYGQTITLAATPNTGYSFSSWTVTKASSGTVTVTSNQFTMPAEDVTVTAAFSANNYTITLNNQSATTAGTASVTATYDASTNLTATPAITVPTKTGYTFGGYYTEVGGSGTQIIAANGNVNANAGSGTYTDSNKKWKYANNITLYAKWTAKTITITWDPGEGATVTPTSSSYTYDGSTVTLPTPTRPLSVFTGWYTEESGGAEITEVGTTNKPTENVSYYAHWRVLSFEVKDQAGTGTADIHLTSTRGVTVYATSGCGNLITIKADNLDAISNLGGGTANKQNIQIKYLDANNGDAEVAKASSPFRLCNNGSSNYNNADGSNINLNGLTNYSQTYSISYTPSEYGKIDHYKLQLRLQNNNTNAITITFDLYGRSLPDEFVIAAKSGSKWYALPNNLAGTQGEQNSIVPVEISVDNTSSPTRAMNVSSTVLYRATDRYTAANKSGIRFTNDGSHWLQTSSTASVYKMWLSGSGGTNAQDWYLKSSNFGAYEVMMDPIGSPTDARRIELYESYIGYHGSRTGTGNIYFLPVEYTDMSAEIMEWGTDHVVVDLRSAGSVTKVKTQVGTGALSSAQTLASIKKDEGVYRVAVTLSESDAAKNLKLLFYNDSEVLQGGAKNTIPLLISANDATTGGLSLSKADAATCDLVVLDGGVLTVSETTDGAKYTFQDLYVYGGGKMVVPSGRYISFSNVYLRGGHLNSSWEYQYSNPQLVLNGTMGNSSNTINYDYLTNNAQFYSLALPYQVQLANIVNPYFNNKQSWEIHAYDGTKRASGSQVDGWYDVEVGSTGANTGNIAALTSSSYLTPGVGYTFWGAMQKVNSIRQKWSINRFPMTLASGSAEAAKAGVSVVAYGMTDGMPNDGVAVNDAGWNMLGNPYLANIGGTESFESSLSALIVGYHNEKELDGSGNWTGAWKEVEDAANVRYVRIPHDNGMDYDQVRVKDATFKSFRHFFIQAATSGTFTFSLSQRAQEAPARVQNNGATLPDEMDIDFILSNGEEQATFGLTVNDKLNTGFVVGEDMPEELGGTSSKAYTIAAENKLAYNGLPSTAAEQYIPVGYRAEAAGTYTFAYKPDEYTTYIKHIRLIDYATGDVTDLLDDTYEFSTEQGIFDERFALNVEFGRRKIPTGMEGTGINADQPVKFIRDDKMYILRNGVIYDATGKRVNVINK